ncbi:MAG TPA: metallopeptidase TldD-related protein [Candidatus Binataceae bacterium]|nr:metallopeptidase TldD-related protein [Candidatus Binataceae bacterium]
MRTAAELKNFVREARAMLGRERDLAGFEIYCASAEHRVARLAYTSDIPCHGVEELKSHVADGFTVRIVMRRDAREIGLATEAGDLSLEALRAALVRARSAALVDPHFPGLPATPHSSGLPKTSSATPRMLAHGPAAAAAGGLMRTSDGALVEAAWRIVGGALEAFTPSPAAAMGGRPPGLVLGGDVSMMRDRMALASSNFAGVRAEAGAHFTCTVTALVESLGAKGTAAALGATPGGMRAAVACAGRDAVARALALGGGERPPGGTYRVVFGAQPVAEILNYMVVPSLSTGAFHAASTAYHGRFGAQVMDPRLTLIDDPAAARGAIRRRITCEGLPARRTIMIRDGRLVGLLSNFYDSHRLATDEHRAEKLGPLGAARTNFPPNSGYRLGESAVRRFDASPGSAATNVIMRARGGKNERELIRAVGEGLYVGRVWYTYPINGQRAGDFTCTVSGDSYLIRNGVLAAPLAPNALRINANLEQVFAHPIGVGNRAEPALVWGAPEAYYTSALAAEGIPFSVIEASQSAME